MIRSRARLPYSRLHGLWPLSLARSPLSLLVALPLLLLLLAPLGGCFGEAETGPVKINWDRDACHVCRMLISDRRFAAQVRGGPRHKAFKFDDLGELIIWLDQQKWKDDKDVEIWVMDVDTGTRWLDARKAFYISGQHSPMDYGFGAVEKMRKDAISYGEMMKKTRARGSTYHCLPPEQSAS